MSATPEYDTQATLHQIHQLNFSGNIIPHSWYSKITFSNDKPDLIAMMILSEIIYWYRPTIIKDERTGKLLGYEKKFKADKLQRSIKSFADQFGISKRQAADALKRLEEAGFITRELRVLETPLGKLGNVLYLAPVVEKIAEIQSTLPLVQSNVVGGNSELSEDGDGYPLCNQTHKEVHPNVGGGTSERSTYTENTTQITTENTAAAPLRDDSTPTSQLAAAKSILLEESDAVGAEVLIDATLTAKQLRQVKIEVQTLAAGCKLDEPDRLITEICAGLIDPNCFTKCGKHFYHKLKAIMNSLRKHTWNTPHALMLEQQQQAPKQQQVHADKIKKFKDELNAEEALINYCNDMLRYATNHPNIDVAKMKSDRSRHEQNLHELKIKFNNFITAGGIAC